MSSRDLASRLDVPLPVLRGVLKRLTRQGIVRSTRGPKGGYRLARRPEEITLVDLIEAMEGPMKLAVCCRPPGDTARQSCELEGNCQVQHPVRQINRLIRAALSRISLAQVASNEIPQDLGELIRSSPPSVSAFCTCHLRGEECDHPQQGKHGPASRFQQLEEASEHLARRAGEASTQNP